MRTIVITPPEPFVELDTAKAHLRVTDDTEDTLIAAYIAAACGHIDGPAGWLNRAIGQQTLEMRGSFFTGCDWALPFPPVTSVISVKYLDSDGAEQTLDPDQYDVRGNVVARAYGTSWPSSRSTAETVRVRYEAGYEVIPPAIIAATLLMVGDLYNFRETAVGGQGAAAVAVPMSTAVEALLAPFRVYG
jgi:uncharacterized phiE125 gp8 family phage protein